MPSLPTRIIIWFEKVLRMDERMSRYAGASEDRDKFVEYIQRMRRLDQKIPPRFLRKSFRISEQQVQGFPMFLLSRYDGRNNKVLLYFHGGAYNVGPLMPQWARMRDLVEKYHCTVAVLDYPKSPDFQCGKTMEVCMEAYDRLAMAFGKENISLIGDSAGGGLALALSMQRKASEKSLPQRLILISPWMDVSMSHKEIPDFEPLDLSLDPVGLKVQGKYYAGDVDLNDAMVSPAFGDMAGQPPMDVFVGTHELFYPDCRDFCEKYSAQGVVMHAYEEMQHDWVMMPTPEGDQAMSEIIEILQTLE